jgi:tetratricopeptide (TPR) repeat protein
MLLFCAVELDNPKKIVKFFEILKERFGSVEIPFDKSLLIAGAYGKLGEEELALQVYQGLMEASFLKESNIAADLEDQGKFLESVAFMENLLLDYPDLPMLVGSHFSLTQSIYDHAESGAAEPGRARLIARAARMLRAFLSIHPEHKLADQAGFSLANAYLTLKAGKMAGDLAEVLVKVHGESPFLDEFHYIASLAYFRAHEWARALRHAEKVAAGRFVMPDGAKGDSPKKHLATYIMGQIHHARGDFTKAAAHYEKVGDRFADARAALEQFKWKRLFLPEIIPFKTGEVVEVKVTHRNVEHLELLVYPVDLMKLYLMRKNLDKVASVNLAGIKPFHAREVALGGGREFKDHETTVSLPVKKDGAYLVVAKGKGIEASGLVLVSGLKLEVQEDTRSGRLRVTVRNETSGLFEEDAHVKVVGSESGEFVSGDTDLRGVFEAGALIGTATVVVKKETSYAFFRGDSVHRPLEAVRRRAARGAELFGRPMAGKAPVQNLALGGLAESQELLERELNQSNRTLQKRNVKDLKALTRVRQKGMQAKQARRK